MNIKFLQKILKLEGHKHLRKTRPILACASVTNDLVTVSDLETTVVLEGKFELASGIYEIDNFIHALSATTYSINDFPVFPDCDFPHEFTVPVSTLKILLKHASEDETRPALMGVSLRDGELAATDGHTAIVVPVDYLGEEKIIIPSAFLRKVLQVESTGNVCFYFNDSEISYSKDGEFSIYGRLVQREYPNYRAIVPSKFVAYAHVITANIPERKLVKILNPRMTVRLQSIEQNLILICGERSFTIGHVSSGEIDCYFNFDLFERCLVSRVEDMSFTGSLSPCVFNVGTLRILTPMKG